MHKYFFFQCNLQGGGSFEELLPTSDGSFDVRTMGGGTLINQRNLAAITMSWRHLRKNKALE